MRVRLSLDYRRIKSMKLGEIVKKLNLIDSNVDMDTEISGISYDS